MNEAERIERTSSPATVSSLTRDLHRLGVADGMSLLVHSSLSSLGYVAGGAHAVVLALEEAVGPSGTVVMPAFTAELSDPAAWKHPPVPASWWDLIRSDTPAFDADLTPTRGMGAIPECFRKQKGVVRSRHPQDSFVAWGRHADDIAGDHSLEFGLGEGSPLARIYELDGHVLLLGVGHSNNTSLHLAEYRASFSGKRLARNGAPVSIDGVRRWVEFDDVDINEEDFTRIGADLEIEAGSVRRGRIGLAEARLMRQREVVDYAVQWMERNR
ncbi:MAG: aminoglycoside N(3)-acetyltransferase [Actinomycetota bacterium]